MVLLALETPDEFVSTPFSWDGETNSLGDGADLILLQEAMWAVGVTTVFEHKDISQIASEAVKALFFGTLAK